MRRAAVPVSEPPSRRRVAGHIGARAQSPERHVIYHDTRRRSYCGSGRRFAGLADDAGGMIGEVAFEAQIRYGLEGWLVAGVSFVPDRAAGIAYACCQRDPWAGGRATIASSPTAPTVVALPGWVPARR